MFKGKYITINELKKERGHYVIKDKSDIIMGRFFILDLNEKDEFCLLRISFYKNNRNHILEAIEGMLKYLFDDMEMNKVNLVASEEMNFDIFTTLGFRFEGFFSDSIIKNNEFYSELIFGIDYDLYKSSFVRRNVVLQGKNIELRVLTPKYAESLLDYTIRNKEHLAPYEPIRDSQYFTLEYQRKVIIEEYRSYLNGKSVSFGIFENDNLIGKIKISNIIMGIFRNATIGYSMDKDQQGRGYMKEAVSLVLKYAFKELELHRIEASALVDNIRSLRVLKACGFKELGVNEKYLFINGEWKDHITLYKTKE